ncbi:MAG: LysR family transcriptional regulator [Roseobacter sp.]
MNYIGNTTGITLSMVRAFVVLSECLNLSKTCEILGATRQTVRRHINDLEAIKGAPLFSVENRQYFLTPFGQASVEDARFILRQVETWSGQSNLSRNSTLGLERNEYTDRAGKVFYSQQHPIFRIGASGLPIMKSALAAWGNAQTQIENEAMAAIRPYLVVFRKGSNGWVFVEVGKHSAYSRWFGWVWSKSAIGKLLQEDNAGDDYNEFIAGAYARIYDEGGVRLDHVFAYLPKGGSDDLVPVSFQRLLLGCVFPDGTPGLAVLVLITNEVEIDALDKSEFPDLPAELIMDFEI